LVAWIRETGIAGSWISDNSNPGAQAPVKSSKKKMLGEHGSSPALRPFRAHSSPIDREDMAKMETVILAARLSWI